MTRRLWARRPHDDRGTSLVLALIFTTVGSLVLMAVLALADTSMRTTIQLSSQASATAAAEGAANIAINDLRDGFYAGAGNCFTGGVNRNLNGFYQHSDGTWDSAVVTCALDPASSTAAVPTSALLTLDTTPAGPLGLGPFGIWVTSTQIGGPTVSLRTTGDVHSNSNITILKTIVNPVVNLTSSGAIGANQGCTSGTGFFTPPGPTCNTGPPTVADPVTAAPGYLPPPLASLPNQTVPPCGPVMTFQQGRYIDSVALTARTTAALCPGGVLHFLPGVYYFDFGPPTAPAAIPWTLTAGTVVGGTLRPGVILGPGMALQNNCVSPIPTGPGWVVPGPDDGVTFVFSGVSQMVVSGSAKVELCGRYVPRSAPIAVTAQPVPATSPLASACTQTNWPCAAVSTVTPTAFVVQGTVYLPTRELLLILNNTTTQRLRGGAVVHRAWATTTRTATDAVIEAPTTERRTVAWLNVYVCPNSPTCTASGQPVLRTKVSIVDPSGAPVAGHRQITVLSWSLQG